MSQADKLVYMANQIAKFFSAQGEERAAAGVADHLLKFWDPDMRRTFLAAVDRDDSNLLPSVKAALPRVRKGNPPAHR
jgi:formate dehydrogenase subunit delta